MEPKGRSTLSKWTCGCQNIRVGTKEFYGQCTKEECGHTFVKADGLTHPIYESPKTGYGQGRQVQLVTEAYQTLIGISAKDENPENTERLQDLREKAQERLFRRLDGLTHER